MEDPFGCSASVIDNASWTKLCRMGLARGTDGRRSAPYRVVLLQVGTALVTPTEGQLYDPTDGAVTVPIVCPDEP
jgi:hypothetical protein